MIKDALKYHAYKRWFGKPSWNANYLFIRACGRLRPGDVTIDAGANLGEITAQLAATGATVHAFEPDPYAFEKLRVKCAHLPNVFLYPKALSDKAGTVRLYRAGNFESDPDLLSQSSSLFEDKKNISSDDYTEVEAVGVLDFIRGLGVPVRVLKIDVEGAEVPILEALLESDVIEIVDGIFAETHEGKIPQLAERTRKLRERVKRDWPKINLDWH